MCVYVGGGGGGIIIPFILCNSNKLVINNITVPNGHARYTCNQVLKQTGCTNLLLGSSGRVVNSLDFYPALCMAYSHL